MTRLSPNLRRRVALAALLAACCLLPPAFSQPPAEPADPLPVKRVPVTPERVGAEMTRLGLPVLEHVPVDDFDARLRRARAAGRSAPHLVEARYFRAELSGDSLIGKGEWKLLRGAGPAAILPLQPLTVAVRQPRFDTRDAVLAEFEGIGPGLLVEGTGEQTVNFDWSARQEPSADGIQLQLGLPPCPVASMELDLPANLVVSADGLPVTGPGMTDKPQLKRWRVTFSGRSSLALTLRRRPEAGEPRVLFAGPLLTQQRLTPGSVEADFTFDHLKVLSGEVRELTCSLDPSLRPHEVTAPEIEGWTYHEPTTPNAAGRLTVRLREPLLSGSLAVRCFAPLGAVSAKGGAAEAVPWSAPGLRLVDAVPGGETLVVQIHPDLSPDGWDPGGFRLVETKGDADGQTLRLTGGLIEAADGKPSDAARPSARVRARGTDFRARETALWRADPEHPSFTAQLNYEVLRGRLFVLPLELPPGYEDVEGIETIPARQVVNYEARAERGKTILYVRLAQSLGSEAKLQLTIRLRPPAPPAAALAWPIPDLVPLGARPREGVLAIDFDEQRFEGHLTGAAMSPTPPEEDWPWRGEVADYYAAYRGSPPRGRLELKPRPPLMHAALSSGVVLAPGRAAVETTLTLQADAGTPQSLDLYVSAPAAAWEWKAAGADNGVASFERLPAPEAAAALSALAARDAAGAAALLGVPRGQWRRLTLRRPLKPPASLKLQVVTDLARGPDGRWEVPLLAVGGPGAGEGKVALYLAGADLVRIDGLGLREAEPGAERPGAAPPWRTFRYGEAPVGLALRGPAAGPGRPAGAAIDRASLTTTVESGGRLVHLFRFQTWGWPDPSLPLRLPAGARLLSVKVNGLWVDRLPPAADDGGESRIDLPAPERADSSGPGLRRYEVAYATDGLSGWLGSRLEAPAPRLPLPPLAFQRRWRLPPGVVPLSDSRVRALPSADAERPGGEIGDAGPPTFDLLKPLGLEGWEDRQRQDVAAAARAAQPAAGRGAPLGEALERVACDAAVREPLVIDAAALDEAGLAPSTVPPWPADAGKGAALFWEAIGLVYVPCRAAPLLTTRRRREAWQAAGGEAGWVPPSVEAAVAEAAANGHDTSGRFLWAVAWARRRGAAPAAAGASLADPLAPGWTEWEPVAGSADGAALTTARRAPIRAAGVALGALLVAVFWGLRRRPARLRLAVLLLWLAAAGVVLLWLPHALHGLAWGSLLAGGALGLGWYLWSAARAAPAKPAPSSRPSARGVAAAAVLALLAGGAALFVRAAPPAPTRATVLVLPGPDGAPERQVVLASPELLRQIDAVAATGSPHGAVIVAATYEGKAADDHAEFEGRLQVHNFDDAPVTLALPFAGVRLEDDGLLDGAPARLIAAPPGQTGLLLKLDKPGPHRLVLHFRVPITANGSEREVRFRAPRVPQSQLALDLPAAATWLQAPNRQGAVARAESPGGAALARYTIDIGRTDAPLLLRWYEEAAGAPRPELRVREAYLWALRPEAAALTAVLHYTVTRGAPTSLLLGLPEALDIQGVVVRSTEAGRPAPPLKSWHIETAGKRRLRLDFGAPAAPGVYVVAHLVPRHPLPPLATLPLPTPLDVQSLDGLLTYQAEGVEARVANSGRLRAPAGGEAGAKERRAFADLWAAAGEGSLPGLPAPHALRREQGGEPFLQVALRVAPPVVRGGQEVVWRVGERQADLRATARLTAPDRDLSLVEWEVPAEVTVTRVGGRDGREPVWHWSRTGNRVQAWLDHTTGAADVELDGWKSLVPEKNEARFDLPGVRLLGERAETASVRLTPAADLTLTAEETQSLLPLPDPHSSHLYAPRGPSYGGRFRVRHAPAGSEARVLTTVEVVGGQLGFTSHVEYRSEGEHAIEVVLRHWDGTARLEVRGARSQAVARPPGGEHAWVIDLPGGPARVVALTLSGTMPSPAGGVPFPDVAVSGAARIERWLSAGRGLAAEQVKGLSDAAAPLPADALLPAAGRAEAAKLLAEGGSLWKVAAPDWGLRLLPRQRPDGEAPVRVVLTERTSAVVDGRHWAHEAILWLYHEANTDLNVSLPPAARLLGVTVDGQAVTPLQASEDSLWVPLPGAAGARRVRLRWAFDPDGEPLDRPRLQRPRPRGAADGLVVWAVHVPAEYAASLGAAGERGRAVPCGPAAADLARAEAQYRLSAALVEGPGAPQEAALSQAQRRFYQFCRHAEAARLLTGSRAGPVNLLGQGFDDWLRELREKNGELARAHKFEKLREQAERDAAEAAPRALEPAAPGELPQLAGVGMVQAPGPRGDPLPERGTPLRWQSDPETDSPQLALTPAGGQQVKRSVGLTVLLAVLLLAVWALAHFPGVLAWVRAFWPEQVALLGCLGWQTYGPAPPLLLLVAVGVLARLLFLGRRLLALLHRPASEPSRVGSANPAASAEPRPSGT